MKYSFRLLLLVSLIFAPRLTAQLSPRYTPSIVERGSVALDSLDRPVISGSPSMQCIMSGGLYIDSLVVADDDLAHPELDETITITVLSPDWMVANPSIIPPGTGSASHSIFIQGHIASAAGRTLVVVEARDRSGAADTFSYEVMVSEPVIFSMPLHVRNTRGDQGEYSSQELILGVGRNATTGDDSRTRGRLDSNYCEYELPPAPPLGAFDARWIIPTRTGILRNIQPENPNAGEDWIHWSGSFQPGFDEGEPLHFPIVISWLISDALRFGSRLDIRDPLRGAIFIVSMKSPYGAGIHRFPSDSSVVIRIKGDTASLEIRESSSLSGFEVYNPIVDLGVDGIRAETSGYTLSTPTPNPFSNATSIAFITPKRGSVDLEIFDIHGNLVRTLVDGMIDAGKQSVIWDGSRADHSAAPNGTYVCRLSAGDVQLTRTVVLLRQ